jgi:hypothetical protein
MKNKFYIALLALALAVSASAQSFVSENFLNGSNILVIPSSTNTYGATNTWNYNPQLVYSNAIITINTFTTPYIYTTNWTVFTNSVQGTTNTAAFRDVDLWANRDGSALTANVAVHVTGLDAAQATNILTVLLTAIPSGGGLANLGASLPASTQGQNQFTFTVTANGTNDVVLATNLPTTFLQGSGRLRAQVQSPTQGTTSGTNCLVKSIRINGWKP